MTEVANHGLLDPATARVRALTEDQAVLAAMLDVEVAWAQALAAVGAGPEGLADFVAGLVRQAELPQKLSECCVEQAMLPKLAEEAAQQWTGTFNPRPVSPPELLRLYEHAF